MHRDHPSFSAKWSLDNLRLGCLHQPRIVHQRVSRWHTDRSIPPRCDAIFLSLLPLVAATLDLGLLGANVSAQTLTDAGVDSQNRFYGVSFMLYGVLLIIVASDMQRYAVILKSTMWVLCAGLARLITVWLYGWPPVLI